MIGFSKRFSNEYDDDVDDRKSKNFKACFSCVLLFALSIIIIFHKNGD